MRTFISFLIAVLFFGCSTTGPKYSELSNDISYINNNKARIVVFSVEEGDALSGNIPAITVDDKKIGDLPSGNFVYTDVNEGRHFIECGALKLPGSCKIALKAAKGKQYFFYVTPKKTQDFYNFIDGRLARNGIESSIISCRGTIVLYPMDEETAMTKLYNLHLHN